MTRLSVYFFIYRPVHPKLVLNVVRKPDPAGFLKKKDFSHSLKGIVAGLIILTLALINLTLFFGLDVHEHTEVQYRHNNWTSPDRILNFEN